ncbi:helix-turn-helix transcriptional regulator [Sphingobacterium thalpophilum]|uniref:Helix-turn-helix transcriptional regulator n=1 Tax=Sphingobacterium thalpophilum TaxID=259 RepID=A0ACD5C0P4_9SPHI|nr:helix-turn-helix transcriptional regulator [Sphingobacterium siyangense]UQA73995.1 helix-turn-helix domain-containing protein [Sphingobacterium siyangense]
MNEERDLPRLIEVGAFLRQLREKAGLSQDQLATRCDLTKSNISNIENGKKDFNFTTFLEYAKGLGKQPQDLLDNDFIFSKKW